VLRLGVLGLGVALSSRTPRPAAAAAPRWRPGHIALAAGHHNTAGGNPGELELVGPITREVARACRARSLDVRVVTPDEGMGTFPGRLADVARQVLTWDAAGWTVDHFLEIHAEGNGGGDVGRGCFVIHPDTDDDVDLVVRDRLGPDLIRRVSAATGVPLRGSGMMSERETAVGARGRRLGVLRASTSFRDPAARALIEVGALTSPQDYAIMQRPGYVERAAEAIADTLADFFPPRPDPLVGFVADW
jgi:N-acetylmuramoyl-L-alanine amidase